MLEFVVDLIQQTHADKEPNQTTIMAIRNVAAALNTSIRKDCEDSCHYLTKIRGCSSNLEVLIRKSFFKIIKGVSNYLAHVDKNVVLELLSCFDWDFKARDFDDLREMTVFKLLHTGVPR